MRVLMLALSMLLMLGLASAMGYRNQLHVFQMIAKEMYPRNEVHQKESVVTLKYLFRHPRWQDRATWKPVDDYIRTGGLKHGVHNLEEISELAVFSHLQHQTVYEDLAYSRPAMDRLRERLVKAAKTEYGFSEDLLVEPSNLGVRKAPLPPAAFANLPRPLTPDEVEARVGDAWKPSHRFEQKRIDRS